MAYSTHDISNMQREIAPEVYEKIDLDIQPERFRTKIDSELDGLMRSLNRDDFDKLLEDPEEIDFYRQLSLMGDPIADAFAARFPELGYDKARGMLDKVLEEGLENVPEAVPELVRLIEDMEKIPDWLDWEKIERHHNKQRLLRAISQEFLMRVAFMMTYMNGYQGLPMIMTGQLTSKSAAGRMRETTSTFKMATLPGALKRDGVAFKSAAKVRVMHAMVRTSLLRNSDRWDYEVYGVPIPQVDQMGAALSSNFFSANKARKQRRPLTDKELDGVEAARYLAYLLGMHDYFLSDDPRAIVRSWSLAGATLRNKFDQRSKELNKATLYAYIRNGNSLFDRFMHMLDVRNTRFLYSRFAGTEMAEKMGVKLTAIDKLATAALVTIIGIKYAAFSSIKLLPGGKKWVDNWAVNETKKQLNMLGEAQYKTDEKKYAVK